MRKINPSDFSVAKRNTVRDINRQIALSLIREHQPLSRADLARQMDVRRGIVSVLVNELIGEGSIYEGSTGDAPRGRKPVYLHIRAQDRFIVAVDLRSEQTYLQLCDFGGQQVALESFATPSTPARFIKKAAQQIFALLDKHHARGKCVGIGMTVPGVVDNKSGRLLFAPRLGWRNASLRQPLAALVGISVEVENVANACALGHMWLGGTRAASEEDFLHVNISEGVGVGVVVNGELLRGRDHLTGEFGHMPMSDDGPVCACGARGCWEVYISNRATVARYLGLDLSVNLANDAHNSKLSAVTINEVIARAQNGNAKAFAAIEQTGRYMGLGLTTLIYGLNPSHIFIGGEITAAWDILEPVIRRTLKERALTEAAARTPLHIAPPLEYPRLRGAAALVAAPAFAAPRVA